MLPCVCVCVNVLLLLLLYERYCIAYALFMINVILDDMNKRTVH